MSLAEQSVIGSIFIDESCVHSVLSIITPEDMHLEIHRSILRAVKDKHEAGEPIDPLTISEKAGIDPAYILEVAKLTPTATNVLEYAELVKKAATNRRLNDLGLYLIGDDDPHEKIAEASKVIEGVETSGRKRVSSPTDSCIRLFDRRQRIENGEILYTRTGYSKLDEKLGGGLVDAGLYFLAGRPGMGKTTVGLSIAENMAKMLLPPLFVSLEMSEYQLMAKRAAALTGINSNVIMQKPMSEAENALLAKAVHEMSQRPFYINDSARTISDIGDLAVSIKGLRCLFIDYFGLIMPERQMNDRVQQMTETSNSLKRLAKRLNIPILCLAQLNRENEKRADKRPQLSDLRETGAAEQDADGVIFIHRDDYYNKLVDKTAASETDIILEKNRHGATGIVKMAMYLATSKITN